MAEKTEDPMLPGGEGPLWYVILRQSSLTVIASIRTLPRLHPFKQHAHTLLISFIFNPIIKLLRILRQIKILFCLTLIYIQLFRLCPNHLSITDLTEYRISPIIRGRLSIQQRFQRPSVYRTGNLSPNQITNRRK